jgi:hypothetical protein
MTPRPFWMYANPETVLMNKQAAAANRANRRPPAKEDPFGAMWIGRERVMTRDESERIEELLQMWFEWTQSYKVKLGYPRAAPYFRNAGTDDTRTEGDEVDMRLNAVTAEQVALCLDGLPLMMKSAVGIHMGNWYVGNAVFKNPRMTPEEQHSTYLAAKAALLPLLRKRSLLREAA